MHAPPRTPRNAPPRTPRNAPLLPCLIFPATVPPPFAHTALSPLRSRCSRSPSHLRFAPLSPAMPTPRRKESAPTPPLRIIPRPARAPRRRVCPPARASHAHAAFSMSNRTSAPPAPPAARWDSRAHTPPPRMSAVPSPPSHFRLARTAASHLHYAHPHCARRWTVVPRQTRLASGPSSRHPPRTPTANAAAASAHACTTIATGIAEVVHTPPPRESPPFAPHTRTRALMSCAAAHYNRRPVRTPPSRPCPPVPAAAAHSNRSHNRRAAPTRTAVVAAPYAAATRIPRLVLTPIPAADLLRRHARLAVRAASSALHSPALLAATVSSAFACAVTSPPHISAPHRAHPLRRLARTTPPARPCTRTHEPHDRGAQSYRLVATIAPRVRKASHAVTPGRPGCDRD
ncbi:hypothetical protein C8F04DRAFT_1271463 [Mycena alexandri]|uniref:Uncharacterized protein n=1 Tax=Mycena alexandri TaxID=1745969 RepID=A0AAD6WSJ2_9AGAR|nr:hypothetical protein C8F04DRAFT_1271463 [Mycena alexandri]